MSNLARDQHRRMDTAAAEAMARDGGSDGAPDIARPRRWKTDTSGQQPKVLVLKLRQRTSAKGNTYLDGWMGRAKLIGFKDAEPDQYGNETWSVYAVTPTPREGLAGGARARTYGRESGRS
jgi:hypothetical protein